jgi:hypothetical protein
MMCFTPIFKAPQVIHIAKFKWRNKELSYKATKFYKQDDGIQPQIDDGEIIECNSSYISLFNSYSFSFYPHDLHTRCVTQPVSGEKGDDGFGIDNAVPGNRRQESNITLWW